MPGTGEMRVLHVIAGISPRLGGPSAAVLNSSAALRRAGIECAIYSTDQATPTRWGIGGRLSSAEISEWGSLDIQLFERQRPYRFSYSPALRAELRREARRFDVVHIHALFLYPQLVASWTALRYGIPYIVSPCGALDPYLRRRNRAAKWLTDAVWQRRMLDRAALIHYKSSEERDLAADLGLQSRAWIVPNGIDWGTFQRLPSTRLAKREIVGDEVAPVVLYHGRLSHKKGLDLLIRAFASLPPTGPRPVLVIAGPDDENLRPALMGLARQLGLERRVRFLPMLGASERLRALAAADVWVLPSHTENFGIAAVEALAAGRATVLSSRVNIVNEALQAGATVATPPDVESIARAINQLLADPEQRSTIGDRARHFAMRFDWDAIAPALTEMYRTAIAGGDSLDTGR